ncbi:hypothetical protein JCM11641_006432 [Rhodosporidiobolus odoratus]
MTDASSRPATYEPLAAANFPHTRTFHPASPPVASPLDSYWTAHFASSLTHRNATGSLPEEADVLIIGSGLTGTCAAAELVDKLIAEPVRDETGRTKTTKVVAVEARTFCSGATGRNGGHLTAYPVGHFDALVEKYGVNDAIRAVHLENEAIRWVLETVRSEGWQEDVDLQAGGGTLILCDSQAQLTSIRASLSSAAKVGLDISSSRFVEPEEARRTWGAACVGGVLVPGNNLYPLKLVTKLFQRALRRSAAAAETARQTGLAPPVQLELYTHTVADSVDKGSLKRDWLVKTSRGNIEASHVLHATNGYASSVLPSFASSPTFPGILPTRAQCLSLLPASPSSPSTPLSAWKNAFSPTSTSPGKGVNTYAFLRGYSAAGEERGEIIIGGMREHTEGWEWGVENDGEVNVEVGKALRKSLKVTWPGVFDVRRKGSTSRRKPETEELQVQREWTGIMGYRAEGIPLVGPVYIDSRKQEGQWIAAGYSGHGMPRAPPSAHLIASLIHHNLVGSSTPFQLPPFFPRHLLATSHGKGDASTTLTEESEKEKNKEAGWVLVEKTVGEISL